MTDPALSMEVDALYAPTRTPEKPRQGGGRPKQGAYLLDGIKVPSVSTIIKRFAPSDALIYWAWKQGSEGIPLNEARDKAGAIGSNVHDAIESFIGGTSADECRAKLTTDGATLEDATQAIRSFDAFVRWFASQGLTVTVTEEPLVSRLYRFGGTPDALARRGDDLVLLDWKTSKGVIYPEHIVQVTAYAHLYDEACGEMPTELHVLRPSKKTGGFNHFCIPTSATAKAWDYFLAIREAYELDKAAKDLLG